MADHDAQRRMPRSAPCRTACDITDVLYRYASTIDRFDLRRPARACSPTTCGRSTATPIRSSGGDAVAELDRRGDRERRLAAPPAQRLPRRRRRRPRRGARLPHVAPGVRGRSGRRRSCSSAATTTSCGASATAGGSAGSCSRSCGARRRRTPTGYLALDRRPRAAGADAPMRAAEPFALARARRCATGSWPRRTRSGLVQDGLPLPGDAEYWRRLAAGGAAMLIGGGTVIAPESTLAARNIHEAWRPEAVPGDGAAGGGDPRRGRASRSASSCTSAARRSAPSSWFSPGRAVGGALAARADAAAAR